MNKKLEMHGRDHMPGSADPILDVNWFYVGTVGNGDVSDDSILSAAYSPPFQNGWTNADPASDQVRFQVGVGGWTYIQGTPSGGAAETVVFTLPEGFRPDRQYKATSHGADANSITFWIVDTNGDVTLEGTGVLAGTTAGGDLTGSFPSPELTTTGVTAGTYGTASVVGRFTVDTKGRLTAASNATIAITESNITLSDVATLNAGTSQHGLLRKLANDTSLFMRSDGTWAAPTGGTGGGITSPLSTKGDIWVYGTADTRLPLGTQGQILSVATSEATGLSWIAASSGSPELLSLFVQTAGTTTTTTSTTPADVDATNAAVTFTAPSSGTVYIRVIAECAMSNAVQNAFFGIRESTTNVVGTRFACQGNATFNQEFLINWSAKVTGISAGSHTYKLAFAVNGGATFTVRQIGSSSIIHPVTMEVWSA